MSTLSVCAIAHNEAELIGPMLHSVDLLADEIIIGIDTRTDDDTMRIAQDYGAVTLPVKWRDDFSYARNLTLEQARSRWILVLDADERLTREGANAIRQVVGFAPVAPGPDAVTGLSFLHGQFNRDQSVLFGCDYGSMRLFRNTPDIRYQGVVHESPVWLPDPPSTRVGAVEGVLAIAHVGYDPEIWAARQKRQRNIELLRQRIANDPGDEYAAGLLKAHEENAGAYLLTPS